ncbi:RICIN domain-containing protein [Micromonospora sp. DT233]|uniref:RICIN domain-containing protein n=1 Tax=Micromonospora sp. DT233 TaxID=3393432 RepID=UPI003CEE569B
MRVGSFKRVIARLAVVMVAIGAPAMVTATPAQAQYVPVNAWGKLYNETSIGHSLYSVNPNYYIFMSSITPRQSWIIKDNAPNGHTIFHAAGCLDSNAAGSVYILGCNNGDYQRWHFYAMPGTSNHWQIENKATGLCLSVNPGEVLAARYCEDKPANRWFVIS